MFSYNPRGHTDFHEALWGASISYEVKSFSGVRRFQQQGSRHIIVDSLLPATPIYRYKVWGSGFSIEGPKFLNSNLRRLLHCSNVRGMSAAKIRSLSSYPPNKQTWKLTKSPFQGNLWGLPCYLLAGNIRPLLTSHPSCSHGDFSLSPIP